MSQKRVRRFAPIVTVQIGKVEGSTSSIVGSVETTWICVTEFKDSVKTGLFSSTDRYRHYWQCVNCGKRRLIGTWDAKGYSYGE